MLEASRGRPFQAPLVLRVKVARARVRACVRACVVVSGWVGGGACVRACVGGVGLGLGLGVGVRWCKEGKDSPTLEDALPLLTHRVCKERRIGSRRVST